MTSIDSILRIAISGLNANQALLTTTTSNVANVNTPGYARRVTDLQSVNQGGGAGVEAIGLRRFTDDFLDKELRIVAADFRRYEAMNIIHERLQSFLGRPDENTTFTGRLQEMFDSLNSLTLEPESLPRRLTSIQGLKDFGDETDRIAQRIQSLRGEADRRISDGVTAVNDAIDLIHILNPKIARQIATGGDSTDLVEQRNEAISVIAEAVGVSLVSTSNNQLYVYTSTGIELVGATRKHLVYTSPGTVTSDTAFSEITVNAVDPFTGTVAATGSALDRNITTGTLRGLIDMRNTELVDFSLELGEMAARVVDELNRVHNDNAAVPAPNTLTGRATGLVAADTHGFTGQMTFAVVPSTGFLNPGGGQGRRIDVDFTAGTFSINGGAATAFTNGTLGGFVTDINTALGAFGSLTLSSTGVLTLDATGATDGVLMVQGGTPSARGGRGFSHFFGMNDVMEAQQEAHFDTGFTSAMAHGFGATGIVNFQLRGPNSEISLAANLDFSAVGGANFSNVLTSLNTSFSGFGTWSLTSAGALQFSPAAAYTEHNVYVSNDTTNRTSTGKSFSALFGIGNRFRVDAAVGVKVVTEIQNDALRLALADVDLTAGSTGPAINKGDNRGALALSAVLNTDLSFRAAGELGAITTKASTYAASVLSQFSTRAELAQNLTEDLDALRSNVEQKVAEVSGVNLDEELSNMVIFQNAYNASARLVTTAREMFDQLLSILG